MDKHAPPKKSILKEKTNYVEPWLTKRLLTFIKHKNNLMVKFHKNYNFNTINIQKAW